MLELLAIFQKAFDYAKDDFSYLLPVIGSVQILLLGLFYKKKILIYLGFFLLLFFAVTFPFMKLIPNLGSDAFYEFQKINLREALFYIKTLNFFAGWSIKHYILWIVILTTYTLTFFVLFFFSKKGFILNFLNINYFIILFIIIVPISLNFYKVSILYNSSEIEKINQEKNIIYDTTNLNIMDNTPNDLSIVLYIGESTSKLHWSLYDYFRPTNINLEKFNKENRLIIFDEVYSTHTHTSPSLLDALSMKINLKNDNSLEIASNYLRYPIVDILNKKLIDTKLFSTQAQSGSWSLGSNLIFKNVKEKKYSSKYNLGDASYVDKNKPYDHEFLNFFNDSFIKDTENKKLYIFHSYAGHGNYKKNIPKNYHFPIDNYFSNHSNQSIFGKYYKKNQKEFLENYDSAMKYVSDNILITLKKISDVKKPIIFIYTSDHGESPLTGRAHDSSRYIWEMSSVPFLMYFNDEAKSKYSELYEDLNYRSQLKNRELLNNFTSLILEIFNIKIINDDQKLDYKSSCKFGEGICLDSFHTIRNQLDSLGAVSFNYPINDKNEYIDNTDRATALSNMHYYFLKNNKYFSICSHRTNSIARFIRFNAILNCMELDIIIENDNLIVSHSENQSNLLNLKDLIKITKNKESILWLDIKNMNSIQKCNQLNKNLNELKTNNNVTFFVEFGSSIVNDLAIYNECIKKIKETNSILSYYIPNNAHLECKKNENLIISSNQPCEYLNLILKKIYDSNLFTDISFDYNNYEFLNKTDYFDKFTLNTWHIPDKEILQLGKKNFRLILPFNDDVNFN